jgi:hypothetical protein
LLADDENDITYSISWAMAQSPFFLARFLSHVLSKPTDLSKVVIRLQQVEKDGGITDMEIESPGEFFVIVEAKRGWNLPSLKQLETYARRPSFSASSRATRRLETFQSNAAGANKHASTPRFCLCYRVCRPKLQPSRDGTVGQSRAGVLRALQEKDAS